MLTASAIGLLSCTIIEKSKELSNTVVTCGKEATVWESLPPSEHNAYDVTVSFKKGDCPRTLITEEKDGTRTTNLISKPKAVTYKRVTKIVLLCGNAEMPMPEGTCTFIVSDVRSSPTDPTATVTVNSSNVYSNAPCNTTGVIFTATNTTGADVTVLWRSGNPCTASMIAERSGATGTITNKFIHDIKTDKELSTIRNTRKLTFSCDGGATSSMSDCTFEIVETEYP